MPTPYSLNVRFTYLLTYLLTYYMNIHMSRLFPVRVTVFVC